MNRLFPVLGGSLAALALVAPSHAATARTAATADHVPDEVLVSFQAGADVNEEGARRGRAGGGRARRPRGPCPEGAAGIGRAYGAGPVEEPARGVRGAQRLHLRLPQPERPLR